MKYPKIDSVFQRDQRGKFTEQFSCSEFDALADIPWTWTEKVDGTNVRIYPLASAPGNEHKWVAGRTDNAQLPPQLLDVLIEICRTTPWASWFDNHDLHDHEVVLYGEGYGGNIQKGLQYRDTPSFVLFDIKIGDIWLTRGGVETAAIELGLDVVPVVFEETLTDAVNLVRGNARDPQKLFLSDWSTAVPEGIVGRPSVDLFNRKGERIITKLKFKDFR